MGNWKIIEIGHNEERRPTETKILYQGPSEDEAGAAYLLPQSLPFADKRVYLGRKRLYPYELPGAFFRHSRQDERQVEL